MGNYLRKCKLVGWAWAVALLISSPVLGEEALPPLEFPNIIEDVRRGAEFDFKIHPDLPVYHFHLVGNRENNCIERIEIRRGDDPAIIQTLAEGGSSEPPVKGREYFRGEDLNFDGFLDIRLQKFWGATGNTGYQVWIFDPGTQKFVFNQELSEVSNPEPIADRQEIATTSVGGMAGQIHDFGRYRWINGKPVLVWEEHQDWLAKENCLLKVIKERRGNELVQVSAERRPLENP